MIVPNICDYLPLDNFILVISDYIIDKKVDEDFEKGICLTLRPGEKRAFDYNPSLFYIHHLYFDICKHIALQRGDPLAMAYYYPRSSAGIGMYRDLCRFKALTGRGL